MKWLQDILIELFRRGPQYDLPVTSEPMEPVSTPKAPPVTQKYLWDTPANATHSVRVICDEQGLSWANKALICACIMQESEFYNTAVNHNKNKLGQITSTDWGLCQINDYYQAGPGKPFTSAGDIVGNPDKAVRFMISMFKSGNLKLWVSYSSGAYEKYLQKFLDFIPQ